MKHEPCEKIRLFISTAPVELSAGSSGKCISSSRGTQRRNCSLWQMEIAGGKDQLFNNDTQYTEKCSFSRNPQNLFNIHEMFLCLCVDIFKLYSELCVGVIVPLLQYILTKLHIVPHLTESIQNILKSKVGPNFISTAGSKCFSCVCQWLSARFDLYELYGGWQRDNTGLVCCSRL